MIRALRYIGLALVFVYFFGGGIAHFVWPDRLLAIVPPYIPFPVAAVYVSGLFEILFALGLIVPTTRQWSGNLLMLLTLAVTAANVHMWLHPDLFPTVPAWFLSGRLVAQVLLLALIWWSTRTPAQVRSVGA